MNNLYKSNVIKIFSLTLLALCFLIQGVHSQDVVKEGNEFTPVKTSKKVDKKEYSEVDVELIKDLLVSELKKDKTWKYEEKQFDRIKIRKNTIFENSKEQIFTFDWIYEAPSKKRSRTNYVLLHRFIKDDVKNETKPIIRISKSYRRLRPGERRTMK